MNPNEYAAAQAAISASVASYVQQFGRLFTRPALPLRDWLNLLQLLFPQVQQARTESATLAREFYDSQRALHHPELPRNDRPLEDYKFEWFVQNMDPARKLMSREDSPEHALTSLTLQSLREVENAGRRQIIHAVKNEPEPDKVLRGWARVATGRETCAWCLMLVSRGPVYSRAETAGLNLHDQTAQRMIAAGEDVSDNMDQWHPGCDCKVVPVFKTEGWPGQEAADHALDLWNSATKEADQLIESGDSRTDNRNREALNALRRRLAHGEIDPSEFAALAA